MRITLFLTVVLINSSVYADIVLDGSLGQSGPLKGPHFIIGAKLGQQYEGNLFQSFSEFNLYQGESATFSGPESINHVISRITGEHFSYIDGLLRSTIPNADFYFLNPNGIVFGQKAQLDVQGSFYVSTADTLYLQEEGQFNAGQIDNSVLTVAPPRAFGFLAPPNPIQVHESVLETLPTKTLSLIGGDLNLENAQLITQGGRINLISLAQSGQINVQTPETVSFEQQGNINLTDHTLLNVSGVGAGSITIRGNRLFINESKIQADTQGNQKGKGVNLVLKEAAIIQGHQIAISNDTFGQGDAGHIVILTPVLEMVGSVIDASTQGNGRAGHIKIEVSQLSLKEGALIMSNSFGPGSGGSVHIESSEQVCLSGQQTKDWHHHEIDFKNKPSTISSSTFNAGPAGQVNLTTGDLKMTMGHISVESQGTGQGGNITIQAQSVTLEQGARITGSTFQGGQGGNLKIDIDGPLTLKGEHDNVSYSGLLTRTHSSAVEAGRGGDIVLTAGELTLSDGATISASTFGAGQGGKIHIAIQGLVTLKGDDSRGEGSFIGAGAWSDAADAGDGGNLILTAQALQIRDGAGIETGTGGLGQGGNILIHVKDHISLSGRKSGDGKSSRILTASEGQMANAGHAGVIELETDQLYLMDNTIISVSSQGTGDGGDLKIKARQIEIKGLSSISANSFGRGQAGNLILEVTGTLSLQNHSTITTETTQADGGNLIVTIGDNLHLENSTLSTSVKGQPGNGGNITLKPTFIILENSQIFAKAQQGQGGYIDITVRGIYDSSNQPLNQVISASSELGIDGVVEIESPEVNENRYLVLPVRLIEEPQQPKSACHLDDFENRSHFTVQYLHGSPPIPEDWQGSHSFKKKRTLSQRQNNEENNPFVPLQLF